MCHLLVEGELTSQTSLLANHPKQPMMANPHRANNNIGNPRLEAVRGGGGPQEVIGVEKIRKEALSIVSHVPQRQQQLQQQQQQR